MPESKFCPRKAIAALLAAFAPLALSCGPLSAVPIGEFPIVVSLDFPPYVADPDDPLDTNWDQRGRLHRPPNDLVGPKKPLILYYHGNGDRGTNNTKQVTNADLNQLFAGTGDSCYILAPQLNSTQTSWNGSVQRNVHTQLAKILTEWNTAEDRFEYNIDWSQIYVTGLSLGGGGTWGAMKLYPIYAAGVPICGVAPQGGGSIEALRDTPIWAFHVRGDTVVPEARTLDRIDEIRDAAGLPEQTWPVANFLPYPSTDGTRYYEEGITRYSAFPVPSTSGTFWPPVYGSYDTHNFSWRRAYYDGEPGNEGMLYDWLFAQQKTGMQLEVDETVLVDIGNASLAGADTQGRAADSNGDVWNCTIMGSDRVLNMPLRSGFMSTSEGRQTQVVVKVTGVFYSFINNGVTSGAGYDAAISQDGWKTADSQPAEFTVFGLTPHAHYRLAMLSSVTDDDGGRGRDVRFSAGGANVDLTTAQVTSATGGIAEFPSVQADEHGRVVLGIAPLGATARRAVINTLEITRVADAEEPAYFDQDFTDLGTDPEDYVNATTLTQDLFSDISSEDPAYAGSWSISGGKLSITRPGVSHADNGAGFTRFTPASGAPDVAEVTFKFSLNGVSNYTEMAVLDIGAMTALPDYNSTTNSGLMGDRLAFKPAGTGKFKLGLTGGNFTPLYDADGTEIAVSWMINVSGSTQGYVGYDSVSYTIPDGCSDLWVNGVRVLSNIPRNSNFGGSTLGGFRFRTGTSEAATFQFDDILIYDSLPQ